MREYKFRGRSIEPLVGDAQWLYGFGVHVVELSDGGKEYWLYTSNGTYQVDPETVGQYTGLRDRNSKEIYEGDIIEELDFTNGAYFPKGRQPKKRTVVEFIIGYVHVRAAYNLNGSMEKGLYDGEVIGNIYDNPNLLEG